MTTLSLVKNRHEQNPFRSMTDSGTVDFHSNSYEHTNDIWVNFWLLCDVPFASWYFKKPVVRYINILLSHTHAHYTGLLITDYVLLSCWHVPASLWLSHMCLPRRWCMMSHLVGTKNISPLSEEQIPILSYQVTWHTFPWTRKPP